MCSSFLSKVLAVLAFASVAMVSCAHKDAVEMNSISAAAVNNPAPFRICAEPNNLPYSQQSTRSGFDVEVAELLAKELGRPLEIKWVQQHDESFFRQTIAANHCDAIMDVPAGFERLLTTKPWYRTGFVFVTKKKQLSKVTSFADPRLRKITFGVPNTGLGETPPMLALGRHDLTKNVRPYSIFATQDIVADVANSKLDAAIVWGPFGSWYAEKEKSSLMVRLTPQRDDKTDLAYNIAIGVRKGNQQLRDQLNMALEHQQEAITAVLNKWRIPLSKPI